MPETVLLALFILIKNQEDTQMSEQVTDTSNQASTQEAVTPTEKAVETQATPAESPKADKVVTTTQKSENEEFTNAQAKQLRIAVENETEKKILAQLGIDNIDGLAAVKSAYENSLSAADKAAKDMKTLLTTNRNMEMQISDYKIANSVLAQLAGANPDDVSDIVKMAKGLIDDNTPIEDAVKKVMALKVKPEAEAEPQKPVLPSGTKLLQPDAKDKASVQTDPFLAGFYQK